MQLRCLFICLLGFLAFPSQANSQPSFDVEQFCTDVAGGSYRVYQVCVEDEMKAMSEIVRVETVPLEPTPAPAAEPASPDAHVAEVRDETVVVCDFENMPLMIMRFRGGMGANDNTVQIGQGEPLRLSVGSGMMVASNAPYGYTFSLHEPATVSVHHQGDSNSRDFYGECITAK